MLSSTKMIFTYNLKALCAMIEDEDCLEHMTMDDDNDDVVSNWLRSLRSIQSKVEQKLDFVHKNSNEKSDEAVERSVDLLGLSSATTNNPHRNNPHCSNNANVDNHDNDDDAVVNEIEVKHIPEGRLSSSGRGFSLSSIRAKTKIFPVRNVESRYYHWKIH